MLGPLARSRVVAGAAALVCGAAGSLLLAGGTSSASAARSASPTSSASSTSSTSSASSVGSATPTRRPVFGPVALRPVAAPLVDASGPLLGHDLTWQLARAPVGPRASGAALGPPGVVGPDSPPARVREVQRLLNASGAQLRVDGSWGPATTRAVQAVQARAGLLVDGRVGPATAAVLRR